jgi:hypothetical protein
MHDLIGGLGARTRACDGDRDRSLVGVELLGDDLERLDVGFLGIGDGIEINWADIALWRVRIRLGP